MRRLAILATALAVGAAGFILAARQTTAVDQDCFGRPVTIYATGGTTVGTSGDDVILGSAGDDTIFGRGGNDRICDYEGTNYADGGTGDDIVEVDGTALGGTGSDYVVADYGAALGGADDDVLVYGLFGAVADGGSGDDSVYGWYATDVRGGSGNDWVENFEGSQAVNGGSGTDECLPNGAAKVTSCETVV
jgi:Ca2+-binding RTX toxin-like protein